MDYQGLDHKETYQRDEQEFQNSREFTQQKRHIKKNQLTETTFRHLEDETRQKRYGQPEFFDLDALIDEDIHVEPQDKQVVDWMDKYRVQPMGRNEGDRIREPTLSRPMPAAVPFVPPPTILANLVRTADKPENVERENRDNDRRRLQIIEMQQRVDDKNEAALKERIRTEEAEAEMEVFAVGEKDFEKHFANDYADILLAHEQLPPIYQEHKYPHTLRETNCLRRKMNYTKRQIRDEIKVRAEFESELRPDKITHTNVDDIPQADDVSILAPTLSEQSSDDEDALSIGPITDAKYQLRGFHYRMGDELRGRFDVLPKSKLERPERRCATRKEWFDQLAPSNPCYSFFKNNESSLPNRAAPTDDNYCIYEPEPCRPRPIDISPIKDMIENVQEQPRIVDAKVPKIRKPKYIRVRKFNLTGYLFGAPKRYKKRLRGFGAGQQSETNKNGISYQMMDKCDAMFKRKMNRNRKMRQNRMRSLGIPIVERNLRTDTQLFTDDRDGSGSDSTESSSQCSDWVPPNDPPLNRGGVTLVSKQSIASGTFLNRALFKQFRTHLAPISPVAIIF